MNKTNAVITALKKHKTTLEESNDNVLTAQLAVSDAQKDLNEALRQRDLQLIRLGILIDQLPDETPEAGQTEEL